MFKALCRRFAIQPLTKQINMIILPLMLCAVLFIGFYLGAFIRNTQHDVAVRETERHMDNVAELIEQMINEYVNTVSVISNNRMLANAIEMLSNRDITRVEEINLYRECFDVLLEPYFAQNSCLRIFTTDDGVVSDGRYVMNGRDFPGGEECLSALLDGTVMDVRVSETKINIGQFESRCLMIGSPIGGAPSNAMLYMIVSERQAIGLYNRLRGVDESVSLTIYSGERFVSVGPQQEDALSRSYSISGVGTLCIQCGYDTIYADANRQWRYSVILTAVTALLLIVFCNIAVHALTRRLRRLDQIIMSLPIAGTSEGLNPIGNDEVTHLELHFKELLAEVEAANKKAVQALDERKDLENRMLRAQFNPHFLYNSLSMIRWGVLESGNVELADDIANLVSFYRGMLSGRSETALLEKELDTIQTYAYLHAKVYRHNIRVERSVRDYADQVPIPRLILQPIMENALKYGLNENGLSVIRLEVWRENSDVHVIIEDNGSGLDEKQLEELNNGEIHETSYGLNSTFQRLLYTYQGRASLKFRRGREGGLCVELSFPV